MRSLIEGEGMITKNISIISVRVIIDLLLIIMSF